MIRNVRIKILDVRFHKQMATDWTYLYGKVMCVHSEVKAQRCHRLGSWKFTEHAFKNSFLS